MKDAPVKWFILTFLAAQTASDLSSDIDRSERDPSGGSLRRSRRYVVFPEGSTFNIAFCMSLKVLSGPDSIFTEGVNWGMSYDLPNETVHDRPKGYDSPAMLGRRKRDFYVKMEKLIDSAGIGGRRCVLKTICEAAQRLPPRRGILEEIFRVLFVNSNAGEPEGAGEEAHREYGEAYRKGSANVNCDDFYPCPVSFLQLGLGFGDFDHPSEYSPMGYY